MNKCFRYQPRILLSQLSLPRCYAAVQTEPPPPGKKKTVVVGLNEKPDPKSVKCDYIGPPDAQSNLRPYVRHYDDDETRLARNLRLKRIEVEAWNTDFWTRHNKRFLREKEDFMRLHKESGTEDVSADQMSHFYKAFLDKNWRIHMMYNLSWYLKNFDILTLAAGVQLQRLLALAKRRT
ncbi:COA8 family protein CG14806, mitochondrial [Drosophila gunungcola]|uniref:COA8 family protein CG14806, mitochondrial n=1 Tax=Drosophila gunungcola TaxID=103775 RepID=UPI0022E3FBD5|nr:COA8 family protein CG14806, mitochondrial [Drosophila gunungcola]